MVIEYQMMDVERIRHQYEQQGYGFLFAYWHLLTFLEQEHLINQLNHINWRLLEKQKALLTQSPGSIVESFEPFADYAYTGNSLDTAEGKRRIQAGELGCLLLAGGQGTRLGFDKPKGCFPISVLQQKSLFQLCAEKVQAAGKQAERPLPLAVMTSPENDADTRNYFKDHHYFGLKPEQVSFYVQGTLPFLDQSGNLFLDTYSSIAKGPDGNGSSLKRFVESGIWEKWWTQGVRYLNTILVDNPLADPFDAELLGYHCRREADITLKCIEKLIPQEKVGIVVTSPNGCRVIEYSELPESEKQARSNDGRLQHRCANLSMFCFSMDFIKRTSVSDQMPLHTAWKASKYVDDKGAIHNAEKPNAWKFETYIFDVLQDTRKVNVLLFARGRCFAPLKNATGDCSPETVKQALLTRDREIIEEITGSKAPSAPIELSADFYYPTKELLAKWKGKSIPEGYIE